MDPSSKGPRTRSKSQPRNPSPLPEEAATANTPSHCTEKPWNKVVRGASTPHAAAMASPKPDHPFESTNPYTSLRSLREGSPDDRFCRLEDLLTPGDLLPPPTGVSLLRRTTSRQRYRTLPRRTYTKYFTAPTLPSPMFSLFRIYNGQLS